MNRALLLLLATLLLCLAAAPLTAQDEEPLQLTYLHWADPVADVVFQELIDQFNAANPDVFITLEGVPNAGYVDYLLTSIAGGAPPDIALVADGDFAVFAPRGALVSNRGIRQRQRGHRPRRRLALRPGSLSLRCRDGRLHDRAHLRTAARRRAHGPLHQRRPLQRTGRAAAGTPTSP